MPRGYTGVSIRTHPKERHTTDYQKPGPRYSSRRQTERKSLMPKSHQRKLHSINPKFHGATTPLANSYTPRLNSEISVYIAQYKLRDTASRMS